MRMVVPVSAVRRDIIVVGRWKQIPAPSGAAYFAPDGAGDDFSACWLQIFRSSRSFTRTPFNGKLGFGRSLTEMRPTRESLRGGRFWGMSCHAATASSQTAGRSPKLKREGFIMMTRREAI